MSPGDGEFEAERARLVSQLAEQRGIERESTLDALRAVPRHAFVPPNRRDEAYADRPLPIGEGQTISAPHMVAVMLDILALSPGDRVLEIGTGCGYHAAATAEVVGPENVYSVEYHDRLASSASDRLSELGYGDIEIRAGDGHQGWTEHAPFDAAYLTCAADSFPDTVVSQVRDGGTLLAPLERQELLPRGGQKLVLAEKRADGTLDRSDHGGVRFVPMQAE